MLRVFGTGWLQKDAWTATQPGTYARIVCFDLMAQGPAQQSAPWRAEIHDATLAEKMAPKLIAGAGVIVHGILEAAPFLDRHQVQKGYTRTVRVQHVEFSRLPIAADQPTNETAAHEPN